MKKHFLGALLLGMVAMIAGCEPEQQPCEPEQQPQGEELKTADQQKEYLFETGKQMIGTFNANDQKEAVRFAEGVYRRYEDFDWEQINDDFYNEFTNGRYKAIFSMPRRVAYIAAGQRMPAAEDASYLFSLAGEGTTFTFNDATETIDIKRNTTGDVIVNFKDENGTACQLRIWGEGNETEYSYTYEKYKWVCDNYNYDYDYCENGHNEFVGNMTIAAKVPATLKMTLKQGDKEIIGFTMSLDTKKNDHINLSYDITVVNMKVAFDAKVNSTNAAVAFSYTYGTTPLLTASANLPKYQLIDKQDKQTWEEWLELYEERYERLLGQIGAGEAKVDILGKVQVKASVNDFAALYDDYTAWDKKYYDYNYEDYRHKYTYDYYGEKITDYYYAWWETPVYTVEAQDAYCKLYNDHCNAAVYYGNDTEQAKLKLQPYSRDGSEYLNNGNRVQYTYYDTEYVFYFPKDDTTYSFEDYFTSVKFKALVDMVEDLINSYIDLDNEFGLEHIHFDID